MRARTKLLLATTLAFAAGVVVTIWFERMYAAQGFLHNSINSAIQPPITPTKVLLVVTFFITIAAIPLAVAEALAERRFAREERRMREDRPADAVAPYEGPEGRGVVFEGPGGRTLLLEAFGGLGEPRVVDLPPAPAADPSPLPADEVLRG